MKTIERELYLEVKDNDEGHEIITELMWWLLDLKHRKAYINGWMGPISTKTNKKSKKSK